MPPPAAPAYNYHGLPSTSAPGPNVSFVEYWSFQQFKNDHARYCPNLSEAIYADYLAFKSFEMGVTAHHANPQPLQAVYMQPGLPTQPQPHPQNPPPEQRKRRRQQPREQAIDSHQPDPGVAADNESTSDSSDSEDSEDSGKQPRRRRCSKADLVLTARGAKLNKQQSAVKKQLKVHFTYFFLAYILY